jgi:ubiquinone/menaquinone biosynthesis C-methylase UbiE
MMQLAMDYAKEESLILRSDFLVGDIHDLKLQENSIDLVISRGSSPFWVDWKQAYSEILRVLKVGGKAYIGGGFGTAELREHIVKTMNKNNPSWRNSFKDKVILEREALPNIMQSLAPHSFEIIDDDSGYWIYITK